MSDGIIEKKEQENTHENTGEHTEKENRWIIIPHRTGERRKHDNKCITLWDRIVKQNEWWKGIEQREQENR